MVVPMNKVGDYEIVKFSKNRKMVFDLIEQSAKKQHIKAIFELDVTKAREILEKYEEKTSEKLSFTGWIIKCIGQAVSEFKIMNSIRKKKRKYYVFEDVDIGLIVEREIKGNRVPTKYYMRRVNEKSFREIHDEIRRVQKQKREGPVLGEVQEDRAAHIFVKMPKFIRRIVWWWIDLNPVLRKKHLGAITLSSVGMFSQHGGWGISMTSETTHFMIGGIARKPGVIDDKIEIREFLSVTVMVDHYIVDGGPFVRFLQRFIDLMTSAYGLEELEK
jgi:pyruvate/2-oxoglutarate dehydrogenase complex dihydrolipoamide acyltransferase (E2) component